MISESQTKKIDLDDVNMWVQIHFGLTEKRATEYISLICKAVGWTIREGFIIAEIQEKEK